MANVIIILLLPFCLTGAFSLSFTGLSLFLVLLPVHFFLHIPEGTKHDASEHQKQDTDIKICKNCANPVYMNSGFQIEHFIRK